MRDCSSQGQFRVGRYEVGTLTRGLDKSHIALSFLFEPHEAYMGVGSC